MEGTNLYKSNVIGENYLLTSILEFKIALFGILPFMAIINTIIWVRVEGSFLFKLCTLGPALVIAFILLVYTPLYKKVAHINHLVKEILFMGDNKIRVTTYSFMVFKSQTLEFNLKEIIANKIVKNLTEKIDVYIMLSYMKNEFFIPKEFFDENWEELCRLLPPAPRHII